MSKSSSQIIKTIKQKVFHFEKPLVIFGSPTHINKKTQDLYVLLNFQVILSAFDL